MTTDISKIIKYDSESMYVLKALYPASGLVTVGTDEPRKPPLAILPTIVRQLEKDTLQNKSTI